MTVKVKFTMKSDQLMMQYRTVAWNKIHVADFLC